MELHTSRKCLAKTCNSLFIVRVQLVLSCAVAASSRSGFAVAALAAGFLAGGGSPSSSHSGRFFMPGSGSAGRPQPRPA